MGQNCGSVLGERAACVAGVVFEDAPRDTFLVATTKQRPRQRHFLQRHIPVATVAGHLAYDATADAFTCPQGHRLKAQKKHTRRGQPTTVYRAPAEACASCPVRAQCTSDKSGVRTIEVHRQYAKIRQMKERLESAEGQELYQQRKSTVEPVFGQGQHNRGVRRLQLRGLSGCGIEWHLLAIGHNVLKFAKRGVKFSRN